MSPSVFKLELEKYYRNEYDSTATKLLNRKWFSWELLIPVRSCDHGTDIPLCQKGRNIGLNQSSTTAKSSCRKMDVTVLILRLFIEEMPSKILLKLEVVPQNIIVLGIYFFKLDSAEENFCHMWI